MQAEPIPEKPKTLRHALLALWVWAGWTFVFGIFQTLRDMPELENAINGPLQNMVTLDPKLMLAASVASYALMAVATVWIIFKIRDGKNWARKCLMANFVIDAVLTLMPPYSMRLLWDMPDLGLQIYALYLLYTHPGKDWFVRKESHEGKKPWWA